MRDFLTGKRILVTGACGTIGREITRILSGGEYGDLEELVGIDNNESELFFLEQQYGKPRSHFFQRDLRDYMGLREVFHDVDFVFHTAALKHVGICEKSPGEAVLTNIIGLENAIKAAHRCRVECFVFTSSDKAVNPTNVMGTSKLMGERLVTAANNSRENRRTLFVSTRFGNVLGSRGSVVPVFREQILSGRDVTLTSREMTRFVMTIAEAARLVIESSAVARGGEVFITKMPVARIEDLAAVMIEALSGREGRRHAPTIKEIGVKPGEKMYEELMSDEEVGRALETKDFFVVLPAFRDLYEIEYTYPDSLHNRVTNSYKSSDEPALSREQLRNYLLENAII
jgi:FlaA1/EpsC-like NDP-sugar epimerase